MEGYDEHELAARMTSEEIDAEARRILGDYGYPEDPAAEEDLRRFVSKLNGHEATRVVDIFQSEPLGRNVLAYALMRWGVFEEKQLREFEERDRKDAG